MLRKLFFVFIGLLLTSTMSFANTQLTLIVSNGHGPTLASAIDAFHDEYPQITIQARTAQQILALSNTELSEFMGSMQSSSFVVGAGLFGPAANALGALAPSRNQIYFSSDHQLVVKSQVAHTPLFSSIEHVAQVSASPLGEFNQWLAKHIQAHPNQRDWLKARSYWQAGGRENLIQLLKWMAQQSGENIPVAAAQAQSPLRWIVNGEIHDEFKAEFIKQDKHKTVVILDNNSGDRTADRQVSKKLCEKMKTYQQNCLVALSYWGQAATDAVTTLLPYKTSLSGIIMLQDFVVGGGEGREQVSEHFTHLNVPVIKAIKSFDRTQFARNVSMDGIAGEKVYYQIAMPELQGVTQPLVVATLGPSHIHALSGLQLDSLAIDEHSVELLVQRLNRWHTLQVKSNKDKKLAIVYYNHPPGRHNIGADNLDVPASIWQILQQLQAAGYDLGTLPNDQTALLDLMQAQGVNLPNNRDALMVMKDEIHTMSRDDYSKYFKTLPPVIQQEMTQGPFGYLHITLKQAIEQGEISFATQRLEHSLEEVHHLLEGINHPARKRALALLTDLEQQYHLAFKGNKHAWVVAQKLVEAIVKTGIEGLRGWGKVPGDVMVLDDELLIPGLQFGNVFIGPQPPRGWEIDEELLHANLAFPPPHQYLAFYHYLRDQFRADAIVHLGRHSTYEFLPRRSVGVMEDDYSRVIAQDIPGIYPYIVDGVGEGIQAKRRGLAVMVDHLTPPLASTPLYDELLQLRQLIESFEANHDSKQAALKTKLVKKIREKVDRLELKQELEQAMSAELAVMGIGFDDVDDDMFVHEVGHYLTDLQERFMPLGLHIFAKPWEPKAIDMMLSSMAPENQQQKQEWQAQLIASPKAERISMLNALQGGFVAPGSGNDPIRSAESLPTGRNFYALDSSLIPSPTAWELGEKMALDARKQNSQTQDKNEAVVLWASDVVRDEGVMIAFGLDMLGVKPVWNSRGLVKSLALLPLANQRVRRNTVFTSSGLFRDLYAKQMWLINDAVLIALSAAGNTIIEKYPALTLALSSALAPLEKMTMGNETLEQNQVAFHWVQQAQVLLTNNVDAKQAGTMASLRVFGASPGSYGAGINRLVERSGSWQARSELANVYMRRMGNAYSEKMFGQPMLDLFKRNIANIENSYLGRSSNLYGLSDNNDAFDYFGGLSLAIETLTGQTPNNYVLNHADQNRVTMQPLNVALKQELRGRFLNPEWLKGLMAHEYAGARTMGSEFLEYLWGWQVTNPAIVDDWVWQEVKSVYLDDRYELGLDRFLLQGHNVHVKSNMLAIMLVAIQKGFWQADAKTKQQLAQEFVNIVNKHGLPGSGHTRPDHPMLPWLKDALSETQWQQLTQLIEQPKKQNNELHTLTEIELTDGQAHRSQNSKNTKQINQDSQQTNITTQVVWFILLAFLMVVLAGFMRQRMMTLNNMKQRA